MNFTHTYWHNTFNVSLSILKNLFSVVVEKLNKNRGRILESENITCLKMRKLLTWEESFQNLKIQVEQDKTLGPLEKLSSWGNFDCLTHWLNTKKVFGLIHKKQLLNRYSSAYSQDKHRALVISGTCTKYSYPCSEKSTRHSVDKFLWFLKCSC